MLLSSVIHRHSTNTENSDEIPFKSTLKRVFLYGTLKTGEKNHHLLQCNGNGISKFMCKAITCIKMPLVVATHYNIPFLLNKPGVGYNVKGEIYEVDDQMLKVLDRLEDVGNFYDRETIIFDVLDSNHKESVEAFVYVLNKYPAGLLNESMMSDYRHCHVKRYISPKDRRHGTSKELLWKEY
uniref:Gamma-glutamylcyclotransferase family protein n=1 Tax=Culicoides sonorensis TaxID=179676 RepID=A0A336MK65_CULSO